MMNSETLDVLKEAYRRAITCSSDKKIQKSDIAMLCGDIISEGIQSGRFTFEDSVTMSNELHDLMSKSTNTANGDKNGQKDINIVSNIREVVIGIETLPDGTKHEIVVGAGSGRPIDHGGPGSQCMGNPYAGPLSGSCSSSKSNTMDYKTEHFRPRSGRLR